MLNTLISAYLATNILLKNPVLNIGDLISAQLSQGQVYLASEEIDLANRYPVQSVSEGFKENILTAVYYFILEATPSGGLKLNPGEVFAFHNEILPEFEKYKIVTQKSGFIAKDGYKTVAGLQGNGVCHLASLMNKTASEAGLEVTAPTSHDFAKILGIEDKYGTSIKYVQNGGSNTQRQNLYIRNNFDYPVAFLFNLEGENLRFSILKD